VAQLRPLGVQRFVTVGLGGLSGLLYTLSIPRSDLGWLAWICLVPCFHAVHVARDRRFCVRSGWIGRAAELGLAFGIVSGIGRVYWIAETLTNYGALAASEAIVTTAALILYLALYPICFFLVISRLLRFGTPIFAWLSACVWIVLEWAQSWVITGFPWELLGYSQYRNLPVIQTVSVTGIYGVSFLVALINASLSQALIFRRRLLTYIGPPAFLLVLALTLGYIRLAELDAASNTSSRIQVGIVQGNIPQGEKWKEGRSQRSTDKYLDLTRQLVQKEGSAALDLIIYPETALPFPLNHPAYDSYRQRIISLVQEIEVPLLVGALKRTSDNQTLNRAFLFDVDGQVVGSYDKVHLVPFGEYLPLPWLFQYMQGLTAQSGAFAEGSGFSSLPLHLRDDRVLPFGVFICFESVFPQITRALVQEGAQFIVNTTNDAWFGRTAAPYQHLSMAIVRAVETGRPLLRAANTGISAVVEPSGQIVQTTRLFDTRVLSASISPSTELTLYVRYGDFFVGICGLVLVGCALITLKRQRSTASIPPSDAHQLQ
jgi:apolipoprotein N-acyltransferase